MAKRKTVTYNSGVVFFVSIRGKDRPPAPPQPGLAPLPMIADDEGLVQKFNLFMKENNIIPFRTLSSGGGGFTALFNMQDADKVDQWLVANIKIRRA